MSCQQTISSNFVFLFVKACSGNHKIFYESGKDEYIATLNLITSSWDTWHPLFPDQTIFYFHTSIVKHFRNKIVSAQWNIWITQILCAVPPKRGFFACADFLFVRDWCRKRHGRVRPVVSSYQVVVHEDASHIRFRCSYLAKHVLHFKSHWNVKVADCPKFVTYSTQSQRCLDILSVC